jgi:hypothetical protein
MILKYTLVFIAGFFSCALIFYSFYYLETEIPFKTGLMVYENPAPSNWINEEDIIIYNDKIILKIPNATISSYAASGSMKPLLDKESNGIRITPKSEQEIKVGDIVSFRLFGRLVVHRVIEKGIDEKGIYFITKGDNNLVNDGKIRFEDIEYVTIGIIW